MGENFFKTKQNNFSLREIQDHLSIFTVKMLQLRHSVIKFQLLSRLLPTTISRLSSTSSNSTENIENVQIPTYIKRTPTDILKALSGTVGFDPTAPHYKYHDDPYLIPTSNATKRVYALAQESGRKSAKWIRQEHAELFQVSLGGIRM